MQKGSFVWFAEIWVFLAHIPWYKVPMNIDQIAPEALKLPAKERALLAASLWESIEDPFELSISRDDEEALNLAQAREQEMEKGKVAPLSHEELMTRLRQ